MAKSDKALQGQRLLSKPIPSLKMYWDGAGEVSSANSNFNGWQSAPSSWPVAQPTMAYYETYFDLSGYELGDLTLVPTVMETQDLGFMTLSGVNMSNYSPRFTVVDIISQERLDPTLVEDDFINNEFTLPADPKSTEDWTQIIMENGRTYTPTSISTMATATYTHMVPSSAGSKGSGSPTTVQKLWVYRFLFLKGATTFAGITLQLPPARTILGASIIKEPDLEYLMRQKRSYELATRKD